MSSSRPARPTAPARRLPAVVLGAAVLALLFVAANTFALTGGDPHDVPVGVAGPPGAAAQVQAAFDARSPGAFDVREYRDASEATAAVRSGSVYGALVVAPPAATVLTASAGGAAVTALATEALSGAAAGAGLRPHVLDVRPAPHADPRGLSLAQVLFGTVLASLVFGAASYVLARRVPRVPRVVAPLVFAAVTGLLVAAVADPLLGVLPGAFWALAGVVALLAAAVAATTSGLARLLGLPGVLTALLVFLWFGNADSGALVPRHLLPTGYDVASPWLPGGAAVDLVRGAVLLDGGELLRPVLVLVGWALAGLAAVLARQEPPNSPSAAAMAVSQVNSSMPSATAT